LEDRKTKEVCPYHVNGNPGRSRSPEEYMYTDQTEKVSMCHLCDGVLLLALRLLVPLTRGVVFICFFFVSKVDVYSFGNILYTLLTLEKPFYDISTEDAQELVIDGKRPRPSSKFGNDNPAVQMWTSNDPIDLALRSAMDMCLIYNITKRASARQVETFLKAELEQIDPGRLQAWARNV
jgi:serine/threonine protein kinase